MLVKYLLSAKRIQYLGVMHVTFTLFSFLHYWHLAFWYCLESFTQISFFSFFTVQKRQFWYCFQYLWTLLLPSVFFAVNTVFRHYLSKNAIVFTTIIFPVLKKSPFSYTTASLPSLPSLRMLFTIFSKNFKALQLVSKMVLRCIRWFSTFYIS